MSLRAFHIIFVVVSVALSLYVGVWGVREYLHERSMTGLAMAVIFFLSAAVLAVYGRKVFLKLKEIP